MFIRYYPGYPIWWKRILHTLVICSISANIFLNRLNNVFQEKGKELAEAAFAIMPSASTIVHGIDKNILPPLEYMENSKLGWVSDRYNLPSSDKLKSEMDKVTFLEDTYRSYQSIFHFTYSLIRLTNILVICPILFSLLWMYQDIKRGKTKVITFFCLIIALIVNVHIYHHLNSYWLSFF